MEQFQLEPSHFLMNSDLIMRNQVSSYDNELREMHPLETVNNEDNHEYQKEQEENNCPPIVSKGHISESDSKLDGLIWSESDSSITFVGQNAWHIPCNITVNYASRVRRLDLSYNCLQTLTGIEYFNCLEELVLDNNLLDDSIRFFYNPLMRTLSINKNQITDLERFMNELTLKLPSLTYLSMLGNPACPDQLSSSEHDEKDYRRYRSYVVHRIPHLKFLDSGPIRAQERADAQQRGHYYRLIRLNSDSAIEKSMQGFREMGEENHYGEKQTTPLPYCENSNPVPKGEVCRMQFESLP